MRKIVVSDIHGSIDSVNHLIDAMNHHDIHEILALGQYHLEITAAAEFHLEKMTTHICDYDI